MPSMQHRVFLTAADRTALQSLLAANATPARTAKRVHALLLTDRNGPGWSDAQVATASALAVRTVCRIRLDWTRRGLAAVHARPRQSTTRPKLDHEQTARLLALCAADPPAGHATWTLRLLAARAVALAIVPTLSYETVRRTLKKTGSSLDSSAAG